MNGPFIFVMAISYWPNWKTFVKEVFRLEVRNRMWQNELICEQMDVDLVFLMVISLIKEVFWLEVRNMLWQNDLFFNQMNGHLIFLMTISYSIDQLKNLCDLCDQMTVFVTKWLVQILKCGTSYSFPVYSTGETIFFLYNQ